MRGTIFGKNHKGQIVRTSSPLASTKFLASDTSACMRSSNSKMTVIEILKNEGSRLNFRNFLFIFNKKQEARVIFGR